MKKKIAIIVTIVLLVAFSGIVVAKNLLDNKDYDEQNKTNEKNQNQTEDNVGEDNLDEDNLENDNIEEDANEVDDNEDEKPTDLPFEDTKEDTTNKNDSGNKNESSSNTTSSSNKNPDTESKNEDIKDNPTKEETKEEDKVVLVSTEEKTEEEVTTKYGVKIITTKTYEVKTYSDGNVEKKEKSSKTTYDRSTFSAESLELKSEATSLASKNKSIYQEVLGYVNTYRSEVNVHDITLDDTLSVLATIRALEMAWSGKFSHDRPDGSSCFTVYSELGYSANAKGENIAYGYINAAAVSDGWYHSTGHRENMQNGMFNKIGIGMAEFEGVKYWVQLFAS